MSKIYAEQVMKAQTLAKGLKKNYDLIKSRCAISMEEIEYLEAMASEAATMNAEVEALREEVGMKASIANRKLEKMKDHMIKYKRLVKSAFDNSMWMNLGIPDKR